MPESFIEGGYVMWALLVVALVMVGHATRAGRALLQKSEVGAGADSDAVSGSVDAVLFWGVFALVLGVLGTVVGLGMAARAIEPAGEVSATLAWAGVRVALVTTVTGLCTLGVAMLIWAVLRARMRAVARLQAA